MTEKLAFYCGVQCVVFLRGTRGSRKDHVLLGRRFRAAGEGQWALPGGHVEPDESPIVTARRELREETGLIGESATLGGTFFTYTTEVPYAHVPVIFEKVQGEPQLMPDERFSALDFFRLDDLPRPLFEPSRVALSGIGEGSAHAFFGDGAGSGASFLRVDMASLDSQENRNRAYTVMFMRDEKTVTLIVAWGRREYRGRTTKRFRFGDLEAGIRKLEEIIKQRVDHSYYVTGVIGDLTIDRILQILPVADSLRVVSDSLMRRLLRDDEFRRTFAHDFYLYQHGVDYSVDAALDDQPTLFEI
jgi:8-oxo-dGTP diphosphatase